MPTSSRFRRTVVAVLVTAAGLATIAAEPAVAGSDRSGRDQSIPTGAGGDAVRPGREAKGDRRVAKGKRAVEGLGRELDRIAGESRMSADELRTALLEDETLGVDDAGTLEVADSLGGTGATVTTGSSSTPIWPVASTLYLHSRPSAPLKIYLDFNGHTTTGTVWNTAYSSFTTPVWGRDADGTTFNTAEAATIQQAYASVAEDFAPFNVDVTTEDPGVEGLRRTTAGDSAYGIRVVVGPNTWLSVNNSGYAKIGSFNWNSDTPAYCFAGSTTSTKQIAECISHETGHTVGLLHDGATGGVEYYTGHANWAPIMGDSYGRPLTQWSRGEYPGANNRQDDLSVIAGYLGWVADDYVGTTATTTTLPAGTTRSGQISWGVGEYDAFKFSLGASRSLNIQSWEWFQAVDTNLNMRVQLTDAAGTVIQTSSPTGNTRTNMTVTLAAGTYYVFVSGVGEGTITTGYSNYGSLGLYNILLQFV